MPVILFAQIRKKVGSLREVSESRVQLGPKMHRNREERKLIKATAAAIENSMVSPLSWIITIATTHRVN